MLGEAFARLALLTLTTSGGGERVDEHPLRIVAPAGNGPMERTTPPKPQVSLGKHVGFAFCFTIRLSVF